MKPHQLALLLLSGFLAGNALAGPPPTKKEPVTDTYHGVAVADDYRWLEDWNNKDVKAWSEAQNAYARGVLDKLPGAETLRKQLTKILTAKTTSHGNFYYRGGQLFAMRRQPPKQQPFLVVMPAPVQPDEARVLVDPNAIDAKGTTAIDWYVPSPDGKLVAVSLSKGGTETGDVHVYDAATAKEVYEVVPRVNGGTAGGDLAWAADGKGFFYTRYPRGQERPAGGHRFLPAGLLPRAGDADGKRPLRDGQGPAAHRRDQAGGRRRHRPAAGHGAERRRRRVRLLSARSGGRMAAIQHASRTSWCRPPSAVTTTCSSSRCRTRRAASCCGCR